MSTIKTQNTSGLLWVTISRPEALNALNAEVLQTLREIIQEAYQNNAIKGIILTGEGDKAFVAGADIKELSSLNAEQAFALAQKGQLLFKQLEDSPKPIIAAINGFALGGGCELAMACHIRIATENAKFGQPEVNLGIIPGYGGTQRLTQLVGRGKALELMLTGDLISAQEAKAIGLVNHVVANREELMTLAQTIMSKILSKGPVAVAHVIKSVNAGFSFEQEGYQAEATSFAACATTEDFKEGTAAFLEKRKPTFSGK
ncbi:MAG: enoyl-CoA hydratase/isomerase family protein [Cyclobacteriaceae bacterium]|nr:enoyl-CoA hydratase/isomerase family protein [Cyclobacteriaceae bacterium]